MGESLRLCRVADLTIGANWTVGVAFAVVATVLAAGPFPSQFPDMPTAAHAGAGVLVAVLFLGSLLVHEVAHAVVARRYGLELEHLTLWLLGGRAEFSAEPPTPRADLRIAGAGSLATLALAAALGLVTTGLAALTGSGILVSALAWLAAINVLLALINLAPAAPLDGGRILRALVWRRTGDLQRATAIAAKVGQLFGFVLVALGLLAFVFLPGIGGLWVALLGGLLMTAAIGEAQQAAPAEWGFDEATVADVMTSAPVTVSGATSVEDFVEQYVLGTPHTAFPVVENGDGRPMGLMTLQRARPVHPSHREATRVREVACPMDKVPVVSPSAAVRGVLPRMSAFPDGRALVVEEGRLVGMVSARDVLRQLGGLGSESVSRSAARSAPAGALPARPARSARPEGAAA